VPALKGRPTFMRPLRGPRARELFGLKPVPTWDNESVTSGQPMKQCLIRDMMAVQTGEPGPKITWAFEALDVRIRTLLT